MLSALLNHVLSTWETQESTYIVGRHKAQPSKCMHVLLNNTQGVTLESLQLVTLRAFYNELEIMVMVNHSTNNTS